ncbi:hypothetical protein ACP70R_022313 [Stipagrostis hirtigluma subsp. patula]
MAPPPSPPELVEDLIEEVLLRIPPDDPARLARAALVCKPWCRVASEPGFRRSMPGARFVPTSSFRPPRAAAGGGGWRALDARHGRVLLANLYCKSGPIGDALVVWDPVTGRRLGLPELPRHRETLPWSSWNAAVLCAAAACDHLDCRRGPFLVALVGASGRKVFGHVYSSEAAGWSQPTSRSGDFDLDGSVRSALVGNAVYFKCAKTMRHIGLPRFKILKYDLSTGQMSVIDTLIRGRCENIPIVLMTTEDNNGGLGFAVVRNSRLEMWARETDPNQGMGWAQSKDIELETLLPADALSTPPELVGFAEGGVLFARTVIGLFSIDIKSEKVRKIHGASSILSVVPYMSFCFPGRALS